MAERFVSACCEGEKCWCGKPAEHKVEESIFFDDPTAWEEVEMPGKGFMSVVAHRIMKRHPLTSYICHEHFAQLMGPAADGAPKPSHLPNRILP